MHRRLFGILTALSPWCVAAIALTACGGKIDTLAIAGPTMAPASNGGLFAAIMPTATGTLSSPVPLPTPASGPYTLAGLAPSLDANQPPAAGVPVGTVGIVTAITTSSLTVTQIPMIAATDSTGGAIPFVNNVPQIGSFQAPLTIAVDANTTTFANSGGLAKLVPGTMIAAAGSGDAQGVLHAALIAPLAFQSTMPAAAHIARHGMSASSLPAKAASSRRTLAAYDTMVTGAFTKKVFNLAPAYKYNTPLVTWATPPVKCYNAIGQSSNSEGIWQAQILPQAVFSLGELDINFPFVVNYNSFPPLFLQTGSNFSGPGAASGWLAFQANPGATNTNFTAQLTAGAELGISLTISNSCPGALPPVQLASATLGYAIQSATTDALPGLSKASQLKAVSCIGINEPLNINLFFDPASGFPNLNPFGDFTAANLSFCDQPTLTGALVTGSVNNVVSGSINPSAFAFDPAQAGPASVNAFGTFTPIGTPLSFTLTSLQYQPVYNDQYQIVYTFLGIPLVSTPGGVPFHVLVAPLTTADVPVKINASPQGLCATVTSGDVFPPATACAPTGTVNVVLCNKPNPTPNSMCQQGVTNSALVTVTDPGYTLLLEVDDTLPGSCGSVTSTDPIAVTPMSGQGPTLTFQIGAGAQQIPDGQGRDCDVFIEQPGPIPIYVDIHLIMPT